MHNNHNSHDDYNDILMININDDNLYTVKTRDGLLLADQKPYIYL